jgi:RNA polymerase sigma-70 factor (ECF subfamily)
MTLLDLINANLGIAHKVCNIYFREPADREDAFQEMMYQLWRSYDRFDGRSKFSTWMYGVCLNTALTYKRKLKESEPLSNVHNQIPEVVKDDITDLLNAAISTLPPVNKAIMLLYLDELSYEEIASIVGLTKSNISVRIVRIKKELGDKLKNYDTTSI